MKYVRKYSSTSQIDTNKVYDCPGVVLAGTTWDNYKMNSCDYGEDSQYTMSLNSSGGIKTTKTHEVGDICYWTGSELDFVPYTEWKSGLGEPIAVCVVPTSHVVAWGGEIARRDSLA